MSPKGPNPRWRPEAACRGLGPDIFFTYKEKNRDKRDELDAHAKEICGMCAVRAACLDYALENKERFGIWGGADENEREVILEQRKLA